MSSDEKALISVRRLSHNTLWNLLGTGAPLLVAIIAIPFLIEGLGTSRFGVLTLVWMVVGYFSLFDFGLGRALTKLVAEKLGTEEKNDIPDLIWTGMGMMAILGLAGGAIVAILTPWLVTSVLKIPENLQAETLDAFYLLAGSIPLVITTTGLRGVLEAYQCFGLVNLIRIPLGVITYLGPLAVIQYSNSLVSVVAILLIARILAWISYSIYCAYIVPELRKSIRFIRSMVTPLLSFGTWMTVTNIIGPLMVYLDRFVIGAAISMAAVAYYATPYEVVTKLWIIPGALVGVLFPAFATIFFNDRSRTERLHIRGVNYIFIALFPLTLIIVTLAHEGLSLWIGHEFANNSTLVLQILATGVFINSLAHVPFALIQSSGRPDITAKLHLIELPFYLGILWWLLDTFSIVGAAMAWLIRVMVDTVVLFLLSKYLLRSKAVFNLRMTLSTFAACCCLVLGGWLPNLGIKLIFITITLFLFLVAAWYLILFSEDRKYIRNYLTRTQLLTTKAK